MVDRGSRRREDCLRRAPGDPASEDRPDPPSGSESWSGVSRSDRPGRRPLDSPGARGQWTRPCPPVGQSKSSDGTTSGRFCLPPGPVATVSGEECGVGLTSVPYPASESRGTGSSVAGPESVLLSSRGVQGPSLVDGLQRPSGIRWSVGVRPLGPTAPTYVWRTSLTGS